MHLRSVHRGRLNFAISSCDTLRGVSYYPSISIAVQVAFHVCSRSHAPAAMQRSVCPFNYASSHLTSVMYSPVALNVSLLSSRSSSNRFCNTGRLDNYLRPL